MAAIRSFEAESVFCEQMVEYAQAASFRNRWDRDRLWLWQQREREASMRLRAARAASEPRPVPVGEASGPLQGAAPDEPEGGSRDPAPFLAQPKNTAPAPTLFDKEAA